MTLVAWLDGVRAYQDAETSYWTLWADYMTGRAALERAVGFALFTGAATPAPQD